MQRRRSNGFTLIEIMITSAVLGILVIGIYSVLAASQSLYATGITRQEIQDRVRRALNEIAIELRQSSSGSGAAITFDTLPSSAGDDSVVFCVCTGFTAGVTTWSAPITYRTIDGDDDADDGIDNNRNKMTDERKIVRIQTGRPTRVIADNVREGSLQFTRVLTAGLVDNITVALTMQGVDAQGKVIEASGTVMVDLRNQ